MTQVYVRAKGPKGLTSAAWKYAQKVQVALESRRKVRDRREAEAKRVTLPKLKWMETHGR